MSRRRTTKNPAPKPSRSAAPPPVEEQPSDPQAISTQRKALWALLVFALYAAIGTWGRFDFSDMMGYYDLFAQGLLAGQLHLLYTPEQVNLVDMIPYQGVWHFNWGPFPVLFHLAALLVGATLSDRVACHAAGGG